MGERLIPCIACDRHVRAHADVCPFCGAATAATAAAAGRASVPPKAVAGSLALPSAAVVGFVLLGCSEAAADPPVDGAAPTAIVDAGDAGPDAGADAGTFVAMYGAPGCDVAPSPGRAGFDPEIALAALSVIVAARRRREPS